MADECCNSGCRPCILDAPALPRRTKDDDDRVSPLAPDSHSNFVVTSIRRRGDMALFAFEYVAEKGDPERHRLDLGSGGHLILRLGAVSRPYTPFVRSLIQTFPDEPEERIPASHLTFQILVALREGGEMSALLSRLRLGDVTRWRGPFGGCDSVRSTKTLMICQGTAISPMYSIIDEILADEEDEDTRLTLLYCCKILKSAVFRRELREFASYWNFSYRIYVSRPDKTDVPLYREPIVFGKLTRDAVLEISEGKDFVLVAGSADFIRAYSDTGKRTFVFE